jgi:thiamine kinase
MPITLAHKIQQKLEQTLAQWPQWHCTPDLSRAPETVRVLSSGISNVSVLVESGQHFVVRIDGLNPASNGLNRQSEWRTLGSAHAAGIAPRPCYFNPDLSSLVCEYLPPADLPQPDFAAVGRLMADIHRLPARHHRLDLAERILRYEKHIEHKGLAPGETRLYCHEKIAVLLKKLSLLPTRQVLCHNDLLQANRIYSGGSLWAIDWEYCAMGSPWYDLAVVAYGDALDAADTDVMLRAYLGRPPLPQERITLHHYGCVYCYVELLWYLSQEPTALAPATLESKQAALVNMLEQEAL